MDSVNLLNKEQFLQTMGSSMKGIDTGIELFVDIWHYINNIAEKKMIPKRILSKKTIYSIYMNNDETYEHILISTNRSNYYLVIVVDVIGKNIYGYYLLDLNKEYGLN